MDQTPKATSQLPDLMRSPHLLVRQRKELAELFGYEGRNKYEILNEAGQQIAFAAEQQKGWMGMIGRQMFGHWRNFTITIFDSLRKPMVVVHHPFRWYFSSLRIYSASGEFLGQIEKRFAFFTKRFDILDARGKVILEVASPIWKIWTFPFLSGNRVMAYVKKRWSGFFTEAFTDADNFVVEFPQPTLPNHHRILVLASALYIDLQYFERKANRRD